MSELRYDGRVAVITGAGRGLGRSYALLLASRGAKIVVNDSGVDLKGSSVLGNPAQDVVDEIRAAGGDAIAVTDSVATRAGGSAIVEAAMDQFGRIDILIHNAGNRRRAPLTEMSFDDFDEVVDVHMRGGFHVARSAFPYMAAAGYGRVVFTGSIVGLYGNHQRVNYAVGKASMIGLSNVVALEGATHNIKSNVILPGAITRMAEGRDTSDFPPTMQPDMVAHAVGWLAHESCSISGEMLIAFAGRIARAYVAETEGVFAEDWSIETVAERIDAIRDIGTPVIFPSVPSGHDDHMAYSMAMAKRAVAAE